MQQGAHNYKSKMRHPWASTKRRAKMTDTITYISYLHPKYFTVKFYGFIPVSDFKHEM